MFESGRLTFQRNKDWVARIKIIFGYVPMKNMTVAKSLKFIL